MMQYKKIAPLIVAVSLLFMSACTTVKVENPKPNTGPKQASHLTFIAIGDLPYNKSQEFSLTKLTEAINESNKKDKSYPFIIHHGDFKPAKRSPCTDVENEKHLKWMKKVTVPVFYTPGDNEWTDCDRDRNNPVTSSLSQLKKIRSKFFNPTPHTPPAAWRAQWQTNMPENAIWSVSDIVFSTIHTVGSNNGRKNEEPCAKLPIPTCDTRTDLIAAAEQRDKDNIEWIKSIFARAQQEGATAVVIATQADVLDHNGKTNICTKAEPVVCDGFALIKNALISESKKFAKPVLLLHGDTNPYCWDKGFGGKDAPKLWRLNAAGDFWLIDAVKVTIVAGDDEPFRAEGFRSKLKPAMGGCWIP